MQGAVSVADSAVLAYSHQSRSAVRGEAAKRAAQPPLDSAPRLMHPIDFGDASIIDYRDNAQRTIIRSSASRS